MATILCVDDEPEALAIRKLLLESEGYRVIEARTGAEGLRVLQTDKIDLIVLDYWMSDMKGLAVAQEIKKVNNKIPIIILSGFGELPGEAIGLANRWVLKGRPAQEFLDTVKSLL